MSSCVFAKRKQFTKSFVKTFPSVANINNILYVLNDDITAPNHAELKSITITNLDC